MVPALAHVRARQPTVGVHHRRDHRAVTPIDLRRPKDGEPVPSSSSTSCASPSHVATTGSPPPRSASVTGDGSDTAAPTVATPATSPSSDLTDANGNPPAGVLPTTLTATTTSGSAITLDAKQIQHAAEIIGYGKKLKLDHKYIQVALMTALQESKLRVYANSRVPESMSYPHEAVGRDHDSREPVPAAARRLGVGAGS